MCLAPAASVEMGELQEADVLWPEPDHDDHSGRRQLEARVKHKQPQGAGGEAPRGGDARSRVGASAPVGIRPGPGNATGPSSWAPSCYDDSDEFVPPHLALAARRSEGRVASSVCVGRGRTLKGRDLQSVRTAVLRLTGFLES